MNQYKDLATGISVALAFYSEAVNSFLRIANPKQQCYIVFLMFATSTDSKV